MKNRNLITICQKIQQFSNYEFKIHKFNNMSNFIWPHFVVAFATFALP